MACILTSFSVLGNPVVDVVHGPNFSPLEKLLFLMFLAGTIETFILWCFKYRGWKNLSYIFVVNLVSNFIVNMCYTYLDMRSPYWVLMLEMGAVLFEFLLLGITLKYSKKLLGSIVVANFASFFLGGSIWLVLINFNRFGIGRGLLKAFIMTFKNICTLFYIIYAAIFLILFIYQLILFGEDKFGKNKFDYKSDYKKFKPEEKVKITFIDSEKSVIKKVKIISIDAKKISFEDKENIYECVPSEIIKIKKSGKTIKNMILLLEIFLLTILFEYSISVMTCLRY